MIWRADARGRPSSPPAGYAYCAVAALSLLDDASAPASDPAHYLRAGIPDIPALVRFLSSRQLAYPSAEDDDDDVAATGFNGRANKAADSCYTWWVAGTLSILGRAQPGAAALVAPAPARRFLLGAAQHAIGGFAKHPSAPPDVYHAYLGLAALATLADAEAEHGKGEDGEGGAGLARFDARLCISRGAAKRVESGRERLLRHGSGRGGSETAVVDCDEGEAGEEESRSRWREARRATREALAGRRSSVLDMDRLVYWAGTGTAQGAA